MKSSSSWKSFASLFDLKEASNDIEALHLIPLPDLHPAHHCLHPSNASPFHPHPYLTPNADAAAPHANRFAHSCR